MTHSLAALLAGVLLLSESAFGCSCNMGGTEARFRASDSVFLGQVTRIEDKGTQNAWGEPNVRVFFEITDRWRGRTRDRFLDTSLNSISCWGHAFRVGQRYLVFARRSGQRLNTLWCGGVAPETSIDFADHIDRLEDLTGD